jgi:hypothetical protein
VWVLDSGVLDGGESVSEGVGNGPFSQITVVVLLFVVGDEGEGVRENYNRLAARKKERKLNK